MDQRRPSSLPAVGDVIDGYCITQVVGRGGMATVFAAERTGSAPVAFKFLNAEVAGDESVRRLFLTEAANAVCIAHPNIVWVDHVGVWRDQLYLRMEYVPGVTLAYAIRRVAAVSRRLPNEIAVSIAIYVARALDAMHHLRCSDGRPARLVHRDVAADNVIVAQDGRVTLLDLGVAKRISGESSLSKVFRGKFAYAAPELWRGEPAGAPADVFALGILLVELLTAERAPPMLEVPPRRTLPGALVSGIPESLDLVVASMLEPDPGLRIGSAYDVEMALERAVPRASAVRPAELVRALAKPRDFCVERTAIATEPRVRARVVPRVVPDDHEHTMPLAADDLEALLAVARETGRDDASRSWPPVSGEEHDDSSAVDETTLVTHAAHPRVAEAVAAPALGPVEDAIEVALDERSVPQEPSSEADRTTPFELGGHEPHVSDALLAPMTSRPELHWLSRPMLLLLLLSGTILAAMLTLARANG